MPTSSSTRELILDVAARLFAERGYAATPTRAIADAVGIRQASLYYHFPSKETILVELLRSTVRPSLDFCADLAARGVPAPEALHALVSFDVGLLLRSRGNVGILYSLPDVGGEPFAPFMEERAQLREAYASLARRALGDGVPEVTADLVLGLVEGIIALRRDVPELPPVEGLQQAVADAALRMLRGSAA
ncbi:TetR family transcriptional regulator [Motilibacter rhizosphaerae]|uniref:TetR family transcriptional regulator n=1 Tax=Motilibacter rhizosphaerae TaxID=598652 RepID=A0A4Q7NQD3_9ACTN|nr:TetR/AcrR family transcriptional regulator [Motilibacter rhizosphaerae]RZS87545.1 TetR family transcriptional regulator [Motilibacter rhizosphaerae]